MIVAERQVLSSDEAAFEVVSRLRPGGYCELFVAQGLRGPHAGQRCVLKTLRTDREDDPEVFQTLVLEGAILSRLDHPNVVKLYGTTYLEDKPWLVIEYIDGVSVAVVLETLVARARTMPRPVIYNVLLQTFEALAYIHAAKDIEGRSLNLRHQDLTPSNLLITKDGELKLLDFGLSGWTHHETHGEEGIVYGTPGYLSPEQIQGVPVTGRADVFAAALVAMSMLSETGQSPFARTNVQDSMLATLHGTRASAHDLVPAIPRQVAEMLESCLATRVDDRPTASRAAMTLLSVLERLGTSLASRHEMQTFLADLGLAAEPPAASVAPQLFSTNLLLSEALDLEIPDPTFRAVRR